MYANAKYANKKYTDKKCERKVQNVKYIKE